MERYKKEQDEHRHFLAGLGPRNPLQAGQKVLSGLQDEAPVLENMGVDMSAQGESFAREIHFITAYILIVTQKLLTTDNDHNKRVN
jgi:hypothetical protein